ncbi:hypothetical protein [Gottfriedia acidiceleris]|nr:hypothetical protein [Gottfriedia acidiceleris]
MQSILIKKQKISGLIDYLKQHELLGTKFFIYKKGIKKTKRKIIKI